MTSSSRCAPGLRISRKLSSCASVVGSVTVSPWSTPAIAEIRLADRLVARVAERLGLASGAITVVAVSSAIPSARLAPYSAAQLRIIDAALELFTRHGVGGTSLQMIADALGVTKAAVYHQFKTKEEIVVAAAQ